MLTKLRKNSVSGYLLAAILTLPCMAGSALAARGPGPGGPPGGASQNSAPTITDQSFAVDENSANGTLVSTLVASDPDGDTLSFSITAGNIDGAFAIDVRSGALTVANSAALDYATIAEYSLTVQVADPAGLSASATALVALNTALVTLNDASEDLSLIHI